MFVLRVSITLVILNSLVFHLKYSSNVIIYTLGLTQFDYTKQQYTIYQDLIFLSSCVVKMAYYRNVTLQI